MERLELILGLLLLAPFIASATMQKKTPFRSLALHWPLALIVGFAVAYPVSHYAGDLSVSIGFITFFIAYYFLDKPFRQFVHLYRPRLKKKS